MGSLPHLSSLDELVLIPTQAERELCQDLVDQLPLAEQASVRLCGWGPVQAAIGATRLILELRPSRVWLVGIAGALMDEQSRQIAVNSSGSGQVHRPLQIGCAYEFSQVAIDGIGVGQGAEHVSFVQLGWDRLFGGPSCPGGVILLNSSPVGELQLLSVCSASANAKEAAMRLQRYPKACAEEMESYAVAVVCKQLEVPLRVIRGISNLAGNRKHAEWQAKPAMRSALQLVRELAFSKP